MKGFMRQRGPGWELRVFLGTDPVTGKQRYATRTVRTSRRDAERMLNTIVHEAEQGLAVRTSATTGDLLEAWYEQAAGDFSPATAVEVRGLINRHLQPAVGRIPLNKLKASDLDRYYRQLLIDGGKRGRGGPLKPASVRRIHGVLRRALAQGVRWGWLGVNPAASTSPPRIPQPAIAPPSAVDLGRVLRRAAETDPPLAAHLTLTAATGARRSELVALRWHDVDIDHGTVRIERGIVSGFDGLVEKDTKTHSARRVALDAGTVATLAVHRAAMVERAEFFGASIGERSFVFSHEADCSRPWHPDSVSRAFKRACLREGLPDARLHDLRHFVASQLLSAGVDVRTVAGRLGHRNAATTLNVYAHFLEQADRGAADVMGRLIAVDPPDAAGS